MKLPLFAIWIPTLLFTIFTSCDNPKPMNTKVSDDISNTNNPSTNLGIGPINSVTLTPNIDTILAEKGKEVFNIKCTSCHKPGVKYIGPSLTGLITKHTPEWVMNMILNPDCMIKEDPEAKKLLQQYNAVPMADQSVTIDEARQILEYMRTF